MKNTVASTIIRREFKQELVMKTKKAMALSNWDSNVNGKKILIKIDCNSQEVVPNRGVSPWVFEGVVKEIKDKIPDSEIFVAERTDNFKENLKNWGLLEICKNNSVKIVDLNNEKTKESEGILIPKILFDVDYVISLFASRIEDTGDFFGSLQNVANCVENNTPENLIKIISLINPNFSISDMTTVIKKKGFKKYQLKKLDRVLAAKDSIAIDIVTSKGLGLRPKKIMSIKNAIKENLGKYPEKIIGEAPKTMIEQKRNLPKFIEKLSFKLWKNIEYEKEIKRFLVKNPLYDQEFSKLI